MGDFKPHDPERWVLGPDDKPQPFYMTKDRCLWTVSDESDDNTWLAPAGHVPDDREERLNPWQVLFRAKDFVQTWTTWHTTFDSELSARRAVREMQATGEWDHEQEDCPSPMKAFVAEVFIGRADACEAKVAEWGDKAHAS